MAAVRMTTTKMMINEMAAPEPANTKMFIAKWRHEKDIHNQKDHRLKWLQLEQPKQF